MKITFNINYRTQWGESVYITGNILELGGNNSNKAVKMSLSGVETWTCKIDVHHSIKELEYKFFVKSDSGYIRDEWGRTHSLKITADVTNLIIFSQWQDCTEGKHYYSSALLNAINKRDTSDVIETIKSDSINISIYAPHISPNETLLISGNCDNVGNWVPEDSLEMNDCQFPKWSISLPVNSIPEQFEYKFIIAEKSTKKVIAWENGGNRIFNNRNNAHESIILESGHLFDPLPNWRAAGVAIPVFSLRSKEDMGVGDFIDLKKMIDWAAITGQNFVQILPINDTTMTHTWTDSYPYNANSTFALHPMYIRLEEAGTLKNKKDIAYFESLREELNSLKEVDYERVNNVKTEYMQKLYSEKGSSTLKTKAFKEFLSKNEHWLKPYAAFCVLRDLNGTTDYTLWGEMKEYSDSKVETFVSQHTDEINFIYYLQFHLDSQLRSVRDYAHSKGVVLKGDIPIGISRTSVDAWSNPRLFNLDCQAGAPPDNFSIMGQNWGFPTYNWEEMNKDGFKWWKNRFSKMAEYFDAYRIDHILGFFRIWEIPMDAIHGLLGTFNPALPYTADELRRNYDFWMNADLYTRPYIMDSFLYDFFGEYTEEVKENFLVPRGNGRYDLRPKFDTQRKVVDFFNTQEDCDKNNRIKDALLGLIDQVLFIEDRNNKRHYHPRISAQYTYIYKSLTDYERWTFDRLYNDFFYHRHNDFWYGKAMWKLPPLINSTEMLVCGEDLGMIPACVPAVMDSQSILSLEIQRMPKNPNEEFANPAYYPYMSVAATSTHDMSGIRGWWEENRSTTQHFYNNILHEWGDAPYYAEPWICDRIITSHLESPAMLTILPLQDWLSIDGNIRRENPKEEQINIPANSRHYWRYRMHMNLEDLIENKEFNTRLYDKIKASGR